MTQSPFRAGKAEQSISGVEGIHQPGVPGPFRLGLLSTGPDSKITAAKREVSCCSGGSCSTFVCACLAGKPWISSWYCCTWRNAIIKELLQQPMGVLFSGGTKISDCYLDQRWWIFIWATGSGTDALLTFAWSLQCHFEWLFVVNFQLLVLLAFSLRSNYFQIFGKQTFWLVITESSGRIIKLHKLCSACFVCQH